MGFSFTNCGWDDYQYWLNQDKKTLKKINELIKDIIRNGPLEGIGEPEVLIGDFAGCYNRRINDKDRLIYTFVNEELNIISCRNHYKDK